MPGLTQTASEEIGAYFAQPIAKKSPTGTSTEGSFSSSQYIRRIENLQFPVGVIQICCISPDPLISARVKVFPGSITTKGLTFQPCPKSRAAWDAVPCTAAPPLPFSPVRFSGPIENVLAFERRYRL